MKKFISLHSIICVILNRICKRCKKRYDRIAYEDGIALHTPAINIDGKRNIYVDENGNQLSFTQ